MGKLEYFIVIKKINFQGGVGFKLTLLLWVRGSLWCLKDVGAKRFKAENMCQV